MTDLNRRWVVTVNGDMNTGVAGQAGNPRLHFFDPDLAGRGMIRIEKAVEDNETLYRGPPGLSRNWTLIREWRHAASIT
jgi:hypothetical protein